MQFGGYFRKSRNPGRRFPEINSTGETVEAFCSCTTPNKQWGLIEFSYGSSEFRGTIPPPPGLWKTFCLRQTSKLGQCVMAMMAPFVRLLELLPSSRSLFLIRDFQSTLLLPPVVSPNH